MFRLKDVAPEDNETEYAVEHLSGENYKSELASIAYKISNYDKRFVALLEAENGAWTHDREHNSRNYLCWNDNSWASKRAPNEKENSHRCENGEDGWYWKKHSDWGFCGVNNGYHKSIVDDERFFTDKEWQIQKCYELWTNGVTFYGEKNIPVTIKRFKFND